MTVTLWKSKNLSDLADMCLGKMLDQNKNKGTYFPYLANINVRWGQIELDNLREMKFEPKEFDRYGLESGDIVMCEGGEPGRCAIWKGQTASMMIQKALHRIRAKEGVCSVFLYYSLLNKGIQGHYEAYFTGAAIKHLTGESLEKIKVLIPPLPTQQKIARILSAYDSLIENNLKRIKLLEEMAQLTYEEWFVRMKFPGHEQAVIDPETGLPEGWKEINLDNACTVSGGGTPSKEVNEYWENGDITWFSPTDLSKASNLVLLDSKNKITKKGLQKSSAKLMQPNSFMMTSRATIGLLGIINKPFSTNQGFINITPYENHHKYFLLFNFKSRVQEFYNHASGATFPEISKSKFKRLKINWPSGSILQQWHLKVSPIVDSIANLTEQNQHLKEARDILLPRLMTGMIDVETLSVPEPLSNETLEDHAV